MRTVVLGAGFGGLELTHRVSQALGADADITLIDRSDGFMFGFSKLDVMFGRRDPGSVRMPYDAIARPGVRFVQETVTAIDPTTRRVTTESATFDADALVVALGADLDPAATPGLVETGHEYYSEGGAERLRDQIPAFHAGAAVIGVCGAPFKCPPAPSEAALMLDTYLRERGRREGVTIHVVIPFGAPIPPSPDTSRALEAAFAERDIVFVPEHRVTERREGSVTLDDGQELACNLFLGIPVHRVPEVVEAAGLTVDGWVPVEPGTLRTSFDGVWAVGDVTSVGTPKAGVFAEGAAKVVADQLIAQAQGLSSDDRYDGRGSCYIEFGHDLVGRVDVDFFSTPGHPTGTFTVPSAEGTAEKAAFAADRTARWFGATA